MKNVNFLISITYALIISLFIMLITSICSKAQTWQPNKKYVQAEKKALFQCYGTTKKGERCKLHVKTDGSFCHLHIKQKS